MMKYPAGMRIFGDTFQHRYQLHVPSHTGNQIFCVMFKPLAREAPQDGHHFRQRHYSTPKLFREFSAHRQFPAWRSKKTSGCTRPEMVIVSDRCRPDRRGRRSLLDVPDVLHERRLRRVTCSRTTVRPGRFLRKSTPTTRSTRSRARPDRLV